MVNTDNLKIKAEERKLSGKKTNKLRNQGQIPAIIYGKDKKNLLVSLNSAEFNKIFAEAGETSLIEVVCIVGIHVQIDLDHADFNGVFLTTEYRLDLMMANAFQE